MKNSKFKPQVTLKVPRARLAGMSSGSVRKDKKIERLEKALADRDAIIAQLKEELRRSKQANNNPA